MEIIFFDFEVFYTMSELSERVSEYFVGCLHNNEFFQFYEAKEFIRYVESVASSSNVCLVGFNTTYDTSIINYACSQFRKDASRVQSMSDELIRLINSKEKMYPEDLTHLSNVYTFNLQEIVNKGSGDNTFSMSGTLKIFALNAGFTGWGSTIETINHNNTFPKEQIELYNKNDLLATEFLFNKVNGKEEVETLYLFAKSENLKKRNLSKSLLVSTYIRNRDFFVSPLTLNYHEWRVDMIKRVNLRYPLYDKYRFDTIGEVTIHQGGLHGSELCKYLTSDDVTHIYNVDFASLYPYCLASDFNPVTTDQGKKDILKLIEDRIKLKHSKNPIDKLTASVKKIILNTMYGQSKNHVKLPEGVVYNATAFTVVIAQLSILYLADQLEIRLKDHDIKIYEINTDCVNFTCNLEVDKVNVIIKDIMSNFDLMKSPVEVEELESYFLFKNNNYIFVSKSGEVKVKGSWLISTKSERMTGHTKENPLYYPCIIGMVHLITEFIKKYPKETSYNKFKTPLENSVSIYNRTTGSVSKELTKGSILKINSPSLSSVTFTYDHNTYLSEDDLKSLVIDQFFKKFTTDEWVNGQLKKRTGTVLNKNDLSYYVNKLNTGAWASLTTGYVNNLDLIDLVKPINGYGNYVLPMTVISRITKGIADSLEKEDREDYNLMLLNVIDFDFKSEEDFNTREKLLHTISNLMERDDVLYCEFREWGKIDTHSIDQKVRNGVHLYTTRAFTKSSTYKVLCKDYKQYIDVACKTIHNKHNVTLYQDEHTKCLGDIIDIWKVLQTTCNRIKLDSVIMNTESEVKIDHNRTESLRILDTSLNGNNYFKSLLDVINYPSGYNDWVQVIFKLANLGHAFGVNSDDMVTLLVDSCLQHETRPKTDKDFSTMKGVINNAVIHLLRDDKVLHFKYFTNNFNYLRVNVYVDKLDVFDTIAKVLYDQVGNPYKTEIKNTIHDASFDQCWDSESKITVMKSPTGSGKTTFFVNKMVNELEKSFDNIEYPMGDYVYVTNSKQEVDSFYKAISEKIPKSIYEGRVFKLKRETASKFQPANVNLVITTYSYIKRLGIGALAKCIVKFFELKKPTVVIDEYDVYFESLFTSLTDRNCYVKRDDFRLEKVTRGCNKIDKRDHIIVETFHTEENHSKQIREVEMSNVLFEGSNYTRSFFRNPEFIKGELIRDLPDFKQWRVDDSQIRSSNLENEIENAFLNCKSCYVSEFYPCNVENSIFRGRNCGERTYTFYDTQCLYNIVDMSKKVILCSATVSPHTEDWFPDVWLYDCNSNRIKLDSLNLIVREGKLEHVNEVEGDKILIFFKNKSRYDVFKQNHNDRSNYSFYEGGEALIYNYETINQSNPDIKYLCTYSRSGIGRAVDWDGDTVVIEVGYSVPVDILTAHLNEMKLSTVKEPTDKNYSGLLYKSIYNILYQNVGRLLRSNSSSVKNKRAYIYLNGISSDILVPLMEELKKRVENISLEM